MYLVQFCLSTRRCSSRMILRVITRYLICNFNRRMQVKEGINIGIIFLFWTKNYASYHFCANGIFLFSLVAKLQRHQLTKFVIMSEEWALVFYDIDRNSLYFNLWKISSVYLASWDIKRIENNQSASDRGHNLISKFCNKIFFFSWLR